MRILHTSDWHLGQHFFTKSRAHEHREFLEWVLITVKTQHIDVLIVAGDVFDTGAPPSYARELYNQFIAELQSTRCVLVVTAGNHDSVATLDEAKELLAFLNTKVVTTATAPISERVFLVENCDGSEQVIICAIPFLRARDIVTSQAGLDDKQKGEQLQQAIASHYDACYQYACELREQKAVNAPILMTGHLTVVGASTSDSEREIYIGTLEAFPAGRFPSADYFALGHIHRSQMMGGMSHIRYSGSPIALSFAESRYQKSVTLVEFSSDTLVAITELPLPHFQPMQLIKGDLPQIKQAISALPTSADKPIWLDIEVESQAYLGDLQTNIAQWLEGKAAEVVLLRRSQQQRTVMMKEEENVTLAELSPEEVFAKRLAQAEFTEEEQARIEPITQLYRNVVDELRREETPDTMSTEVNK